MNSTNLIESRPNSATLVFDSEPSEEHVFFCDEFYYEIAERIARSSLFLGSGRHRCTFDYDQDWVLKVPRRGDGERANKQEYEISKGWLNPESYNGDSINGIEFPQCELITFRGIPLLVMEKVTPVYTVRNYDLLDVWREDTPAWVKSLDCHQAGINKHGKWLAYDFSII